MARDKSDKTDKTPAATFATFATRGANEWGIPDWRNAATYGDVGRWTLVRWKWEFTRRNVEFRTDVLRLRERANICAAPVPCECGREPGACSYHDELAAFKERWSYTDWIHPRQQWVDVTNGPEGLSDHEKFVVGILWAPIDPVQMKVGHPGMPSYLSWDNERNRVGDLSENEMATRFNLDYPIADQIRRAKFLLAEAQKARHGKTLQGRAHPKRWLGYLRALDAREAGATWAEMTEIFYSQGLLDRRKAPAGGYCAPPPQAARDMWEAAQALRFNF